ncbi:MAG: M67 family metallopeptidase [Ardenticatenaceae bacterium]|nr:M67 family metallopeptidase [Ardenticatenaceae bacterium]
MLVIDKSVYEAVIIAGQVGYPLEVCGLLAGKNGRITHHYPILNKLQSHVAFEMEPLQQIETMLAIEASGLEILAIYHTHPRSPAIPSPTDIAQAYYPKFIQFILSLQEPERPSLRAFTIINHQVDEIPFSVA